MHPTTVGKINKAIQGLIQYTELNRAGWWQRGVAQLVVATLAIRNAPVLIADIGRLVEATLGVALSQSAIEDALAMIEEDGRACRLGRDLVLSDAEARRLTDVAENVIALEDRVRTRFEESVTAVDSEIELEGLFARFDVEVLSPLVEEMGARTYEALQRKNVDLPTFQPFSTFLDSVGSSDAHALRLAIVDFLDPNIVDVRQWVLGRLNVQFVVESSALSGEVLDAVAAASSERRSLRVFLDTNFAVAFLGFDEPQAVETAKYLRSLRKQVCDSLDVSFYLLPETLAELQQLVSAVLQSLRGVRARGALAEAALGVKQSRISKSYFEAAQAVGGSLTPDEFFGPAERNLLVTLRANGIELFNEQHDLGTDQAVIDDLHDLEEYQTRYRDDGPKVYETNMHDLVLWHFVKRKQLVGASTPIEARYAVATVDFGLIRFDQRKRQGERSFPVTYHPASLVGLLQFWVPRDEALEIALVGALRLPLSYMGFDPVAESLTARMIRALDRYEATASMDPARLTDILTNEAVRTRMASRPADASGAPTQADLETIKVAIVEQIRRDADDAKAADRAEIRDLREELDAERRSSEQMQTVISDLQEKDAVREFAAARRKAWFRWGSQVAIAAVLLAGLAVGIYYLPLPFRPSVQVAVATFSVVVTLSVVAARLIHRRPELHESLLAIWATRWEKRLWIAVGAIGLSLFSSWLYDFLTS